MAWSNSKIFRAYLADIIANTTALDVGADTMKAALYDNDITPDQDAASASTAYNTGQWVASGNEVSDGTNWDAGGEPLTGVSINSATAATVFFDATDTPQGGATTTLANVYGCLVYSNIGTPVANQGVCFNYFGGVQGVTAGTFTIVWHSNGVFRFTL